MQRIYLLIALVLGAVLGSPGFAADAIVPEMRSCKIYSDVGSPKISLSPRNRENTVAKWPKPSKKPSEQDENRASGMPDWLHDAVRRE
jgi:hypothetical protein